MKNEWRHDVTRVDRMSWISGRRWEAIFAESVLDGTTSMGVFLAIISVISRALNADRSKESKESKESKPKSSKKGEAGHVWCNAWSWESRQRERRQSNAIDRVSVSGDMTNDFEGIFIELMRNLDKLGMQKPRRRSCIQSSFTMSLQQLFGENTDQAWSGLSMFMMVYHIRYLNQTKYNKYYSCVLNFW